MRLKSNFVPEVSKPRPFTDIQRMNPVKSVSILGCGWLGMPLAGRLLSSGYQVKASSTSPEKIGRLEAAGMEAFCFQLSDGYPPDAFLQSEILFIAVPPGRTDESRASYLKFFETLSVRPLPAIVKQVIFVSSTSVYAEQNMDVDEETLPQSDEPSGKLLIAVEQALQQIQAPLAILRCGGLIGPGRHPGRFFAGKTAIPNGMAPVNLIHLDDVLSVIQLVIDEQLSGTINVVAPDHPSRSAFYTQAARDGGYELPQFIAELQNWKRVNPAFLLSRNFSFIYPDLLKLSAKCAY